MIQMKELEFPRQWSWKMINCVTHLVFDDLDEVALSILSRTQFTKFASPSEHCLCYTPGIKRFVFDFLENGIQQVSLETPRLWSRDDDSSYVLPLIEWRDPILEDTVSGPTSTQLNVLHIRSRRGRGHVSNQLKPGSTFWFETTWWRNADSITEKWILRMYVPLSICLVFWGSSLQAIACT